MKHRIRRVVRFASPGLVAFVAALALATPASAMRRAAVSMEILVDGRPLTELAARGRTYVEAIEGREYGIRLTNHTSRRLAVALSVDGLNTIDAERTPAREASKWILGPGQSVVLDGWQTASDSARRFFFTTEEESYGAWLGHTSDLGVISAVAFREKRRPRKIAEGRPRARGDADSGRSGERRESEAPSPGAPPRRKSSAGSDRGADTEGALGEWGSTDESFAATGIGREYRHEVRRVAFDADPEPAATLEIRYEYRDALVGLGVLPPVRPSWRERLERRERSRGFASDGFSPDPYRRH
jgi:hypothetical protein